MRALRSRVGVTFVAVVLAMVWASSGAEAAEVPAPGSALAAKLAASPIVKKLNRIAVLLAGEHSGPALEARGAVATAFAAAGHETVVVAVPVAENPNRALLSNILTERSADAVADRQDFNSRRPRAGCAVVLCGARGEPLFEYEGGASTANRALAGTSDSAKALGPPLRVSRELLLLPGRRGLLQRGRQTRPGRTIGTGIRHRRSISGPCDRAVLGATWSSAEFVVCRALRMDSVRPPPPLTRSLTAG